jgi:hypothetical protein
LFVEFLVLLVVPLFVEFLVLLVVPLFVEFLVLLVVPLFVEFLVLLEFPLFTEFPLLVEFLVLLVELESKLLTMTSRLLCNCTGSRTFKLLRRRPIALFNSVIVLSTSDNPVFLARRFMAADFTDELNNNS